MNLDASGREIRVGDLLRVNHFVGRRRKQHHMYFLVFELAGQLRAAHTHLIPKTGLSTDSSLPLTVVLRLSPDATIIDGYACLEGELSFEDRPRYTP